MTRGNQSCGVVPEKGIPRGQYSDDDIIITGTDKEAIELVRTTFDTKFKGDGQWDEVINSFLGMHVEYNGNELFFNVKSKIEDLLPRCCPWAARGSGQVQGTRASGGQAYTHYQRRPREPKEQKFESGPFGTGEFFATHFFSRVSHFITRSA